MFFGKLYIHFYYITMHIHSIDSVLTDELNVSESVGIGEWDADARKINVQFIKNFDKIHHRRQIWYFFFSYSRFCFIVI